jgi:ammonia channel protein AmtB
MVRTPHNVPFILLDAGFSFLTTTLSASAAMLTWCLIDGFRDGKPTAVGGSGLCPRRW